jgi:hypothetical protein
VALAMPQRGHALRERDLPPAPVRRLVGFFHLAGISLTKNLRFRRRYVEIAPLLKVLQEPRCVRGRTTEQFRAALGNRAIVDISCRFLGHSLLLN